MNTIIIDDESHARSVLEELLRASSFSINILDSCSNLIEGVAAIKKHNPDVVFLDVQMPNYAGYEILNFIEKIDFEIIFVTAYDNYAIKAFEINAIDYLVKPIDRNKLRNSLERLHERVNNKQLVTKYEKLSASFQQKKPNKIIIPELNNRRVVDINAIEAIEASGSYTKIHLSDGNSIFTSKNLKYFEDRLMLTNTFFRCHRSWIIDLNSVKKFNRTSGVLILSNEKLQVKISRNLYDEFERVLCQN